MGRTWWRSWRTVVVPAAVITAVWFLVFGSFGDKPGPLGTGQARITAQTSGTVAGRSVVLPAAPGGVLPVSNNARPRSEAEIERIEQQTEKYERGMAARAARLPASDPRVLARAAALPAAESTVQRVNQPSPLADADFAAFRLTEVDPPATFSSSVNEPALAQNVKQAFMTYNWFAARSTDGGATWSGVDPFNTAPFPGATNDFCCDQDVIYDNGKDRWFWERMGYKDIDASANNENRIVVDMSTDGLATSSCSVILRPSSFSLANAFFDYPRMSLSNNYLYMTINVFDFDSGNYMLHMLLRIPIATFCTPVATFWTFDTLAQCNAAPCGWSPTFVESAREIMYGGDQVVTNSGINDQFRVYWMFDDDAVLNFTDRTISPYLFTNRNQASCPVPGGFNPCARADQRVTGAVLEHNTPLPGNLGAAGDKIDFYWGVKAGNNGVQTFTLPYYESAGFHGNSIAYIQRKAAFSNTFTPWNCAAGANDRQHVALACQIFRPVASATNPSIGLAIDDDFNTSAHVAGWTFDEPAGAMSTGNWTASQSGDYLRVRSHRPVGVAWVASGYRRNSAAAEYRPIIVVFGRARDLVGFQRFDQQ